MKRWSGICLVVTVILLITKGDMLYIYGGEFGGFDIDIGADEGIFDNWEEAVEENQGTTEPEQKENGNSNGNESNSNSNNDSANGSNSSNDIENDGNNNSGNNNNNSNSNAGDGLSKTENSDNPGDKDGWEKPQAAGSERRPKENKKEIKKENSVTAASPANKSTENKKTETNINADNSANETESKSNTKKKTPHVKKNSSKSKEEKSGVTAADENISESRITARETKNTDRKKADMSKVKITESPKKENTSEHLKLTGAGTVFAAAGMAKISRKLGFYNKNYENI